MLLPGYFNDIHTLQEENAKDFDGKWAYQLPSSSSLIGNYKKLHWKQTVSFHASFQEERLCPNRSFNRGQNVIRY